MSTTQPPANSSDNYDSPWKEAIEHYFPEFMAFYFPDAHTAIDWAKKYSFLSKLARKMKSAIMLNYA